MHANFELFSVSLYRGATVSIYFKQKEGKYPDVAFNTNRKNRLATPGPHKFIIMPFGQSANDLLTTYYLITFAIDCTLAAP